MMERARAVLVVLALWMALGYVTVTAVRCYGG